MSAKQNDAATARSVRGLKGIGAGKLCHKKAQKAATKKHKNYKNRNGRPQFFPAFVGCLCAFCGQDFFVFFCG
jgi:hypothetical protein